MGFTHTLALVSLLLVFSSTFNALSYETMLAVARVLGTPVVPVQTGRINMTEVFPDLVHPKCCAKMSTPDFTEHEAKMYQECQAQIKQEASKTSEVRGSNPCELAVCVGRKAGLIDMNGYVNETEFTIHAEKFYSPESIKILTREFASTCVNTSNALAQDMAQAEETYQGSHLCNPALHFSVECIKAAVEQNCPDDLRDEGEVCTKHRTHLIDCSVHKGTNSTGNWTIVTNSTYEVEIST